VHCFCATQGILSIALVPQSPGVASGRRIIFFFSSLSFLFDFVFLLPCRLFLVQISFLCSLSHSVKGNAAAASVGFSLIQPTSRQSHYYHCYTHDKQLLLSNLVAFPFVVIVEEIGEAK
jgi:hypothetical protein